MRILGIDPGHIHIGFAIIDYIRNTNDDCSNLQLNILFAQDIDLSSYNDRYRKLYNICLDIIQTYNPDLIIIEKTIVRNNSKTSLLLSQSRGVILLSCEINNIKYEEVTNNKIKKYFCGKGNAKKPEIARKINEKFHLNLLSNANDALMIACYGQLYYPK